MKLLCLCSLDIFEEIFKENRDEAITQRNEYVLNFFLKNNIDLLAIRDLFKFAIEKLSDNISNNTLHITADIPELYHRVHSDQTLTERNLILLFISFLSSFLLLEKNDDVEVYDTLSNIIYDILIEVIGTELFPIFQRFYFHFFEILFQHKYANGKYTFSKLQERINKEGLPAKFSPFLRDLISSFSTTTMNIHIIKYFIDINITEEQLFILLHAVTVFPTSNNCTHFLQNHLNFDEKTRKTSAKFTNAYTTS